MVLPNLAEVITCHTPVSNKMKPSFLPKFRFVQDGKVRLFGVS